MEPLNLFDARILIIDDELDNVRVLEGHLSECGYAHIHSTTESARAMALIEETGPDLILLDLHMSQPDGFTLLAQIRESHSPDDYLPVLLITADASDATRQRALVSGAKDFLTKPFELSEVAFRIGNLLETRALYREQRQARRRAESEQRRALALASASHVLSSSLDYHTTLAMLCRSLVPEVADYCLVDVLGADGRVEREGYAHRDPAKEPLLVTPIYRDPEILPDAHPILAALHHGKSTLLHEINSEQVLDVAANDEDRQLMAALAPQSVVVAPITAPGVTYGALVLVRSESGRRFDEGDLEFGIDLARRAAITLENARLFIKAQDATRARDEMLGIVAHDLRNPLSTITMGSSMLMDLAGSDTARRHAELVHRAAERMQHMIEDLLEIRRLETGKLSVQIRQEDAGSILQEARAMLTPLAAAREITLIADLPESEIRIRADSARILQVLSNLVGNAVKFTPAGGTVRISFECLDDHAKFCVSDTGSGIPREQLPHIFGRFWQALDGDMRGIGLGLSIVKGIVQSHGGRIWVESEPGKGASFFFTLPHEAPAVTVSQEPGAAAKPQGGGAPPSADPIAPAAGTAQPSPQLASPAPEPLPTVRAEATA